MAFSSEVTMKFSAWKVSWSRFETKQPTEWLSWAFFFSSSSFLGELHISISFDYSIDQHTRVTFILTGEIGLQQTPGVSLQRRKKYKKKRHRTHSHTQTQNPHFYDELGAWWERDLKTSISYFILPNQSIYYPKLHFSGSPRTCRSLHNKLRQCGARTRSGIPITAHPGKLLAFFSFCLLCVDNAVRVYVAPRSLDL